MRKYILACWGFACLLAYCGVADTGETAEKKPGAEKDSLIFPMRINGNAGYLYVDVKGDKGTPIVFAHSFGGSAEHWKNQVMHFEHVRKVVTFDFRAHGRSDSASHPNVYTPVNMADDIETVVNFMKLDKFILVGHSMGGSAAIAYAEKHPEKIAGLVLVGTPGKADEQDAKKIMDALQSPRYQKVMDDYMQQLLTNAGAEAEEMVMQEYHKISKPTALAVTESIFKFDPLPFLRIYNGPLLIVSTEKESRQPQALSKQVKHAKKVMIGETSHWLQLDKPAELNRVLDEFLKEHHL